MAAQVDPGQLSATVASCMPRLEQELADLVAIPGLSEWGFPEHTHGPLLETYQALIPLFRDAGVERIASVDLPETAPILIGEIPAPEGAPTVLLYGHYDVVPAGDEELWESPPFTATERDGAIYGRGAADSKSNLLVHVGALRAWGGRPPVGVKLLIHHWIHVPPLVSLGVILASLGTGIGASLLIKKHPEEVLEPGTLPPKSTAAPDTGAEQPSHERTV